ncbi:MAG: pirin family protein [Alphaproteobacteria bacterium]|nr:pirin family protein [Alphaproteobacteria bacterium]
MTTQPVLEYRPSTARGLTEIDWLQSRHSFSFGEYYDPAHMGFGPLRVINEDVVAPGAGFPMHGHAHMEIITYVLSGALQHRDSLGNGDVIRPGDVQAMSAGGGIHHSEFNPSDSEGVHLLQIWILPQARGGDPLYQQTSFDPAGAQNQWQTLVTPDGAGGTLAIRQDASLRAVRLDAAAAVAFDLRPDRKYWLQIARGHVTLAASGLAKLAASGLEKESGDGLQADLRAGDGLGLEKAAGRAILQASESAEILLFDLPQ